MPPIAGAIGAVGSAIGTAQNIGQSVGGLFGGGGTSPAEVRNRLYQQQLQRAQQAEGQFLDETGKPTEGLDKVQQDITSGISPAQVESLKSTNVALKKGGVRGGQAATIMARQSGQVAQEAQQQLNKQLYEDALRRKQAKMGYLSSKAGQLQGSLQ